ncbi:hypothetical protein ACIRBX_09305 [Kitasatospora sp. NPDC096147]|uniref:hypothetical protein n=1 Tax=Kitasatospora sp. NPDC096147 TaxID=3364093 RepID=UPI003810479F
MGLSRLARSFGLASTLALAAVGTVTPASASADIKLKLYGPSAVSIDPAAPADPMSSGNLGLDIGRTGTAAANDVVVTYDVKDLAGIATLKLSDQCTVSGTLYSCKRWSPLEYDRINLTDNGHLLAAKGAKIGSKGVLHVTAAAGNAAGAKLDVEVYVGGPVLEVKQLQVIENAAIGSTVETRLEITNKGTLPANRVIISSYATESLSYEQRFGNCEFGSAKSFAGMEEDWPPSTALLCTVNTAIAPGETVRTDPLRFKVGPSARYDFVSFSALANQEEKDSWLRSSYDLKPASGPHLTFGKPEVPVAEVGGPNIDENHSGKNYTELEVTADSNADFEALAGWTPAGGGATGTLTVGLLNHGPAAILDRSGGEAMPSVEFTLPAGVKATKVPENCHEATGPGAVPGNFSCYHGSWAGSGMRATFDFPLQVPADARAKKFVVSLQNSTSKYEPGHPSAVMGWDKNPGNDLVEISLGEKSTGTKPTAVPTPTKVPTKAPTATPSKSGTAKPQPTKAPTKAPVKATASGSAAPAATATDSATASTGPLASTGGGSSAAPIAVAGGAAIALGLGLIVVVARRRKAGAHR